MHQVRLLVLLVVLLAAGCQVDVAVDVAVAEDGSGTVTVAVGLDDDALARVPDLDEQLRVEDLEASGWEVSGPERDGERTWVRASKPFADPSQLQDVLAQVTGPEGIFRDFSLERTHSFATTEYRLTGSLDTRAGLTVFTDDDLAAALDGDPFGGNLELIEAEEGRPATEMVALTLGVELPGAERVTVPMVLGATEPVPVVAESSVSDPGPRVAVAVAVGAIVLAALVPVRAAFRRRRS